MVSAIEPTSRRARQRKADRKAAGITLPRLSAPENGKTMPHDSTAVALRAALEGADRLHQQ